MTYDLTMLKITSNLNYKVGDPNTPMIHCLIVSPMAEINLS